MFASNKVKFPFGLIKTGGLLVGFIFTIKEDKIASAQCYYRPFNQISNDFLQRYRKAPPIFP